MDLTEEQKQTKSYQEQADEIFYQKFDDPTDTWEFFWNEYGPNALSVVEGCAELLDKVLNSKLIDDAGFLKEDFSLGDWVSKSTEAHLMECLGNNPENYKDALLYCMENFAEQIEKEEDFERAHVLCDRVRSIELDVFHDSSPVKTQEHGNPPRNTDRVSEKSPESDAAAGGSPSSGQGPP